MSMKWHGTHAFASIFEKLLAIKICICKRALPGMNEVPGESSPMSIMMADCSKFIDILLLDQLKMPKIIS